MKRKFSITIMLLLSYALLDAQEICRIRSFDGEELIGRLMFPDSNFINILVIDVPGTGPSTYTADRRLPGYPAFAYHDIIATEFRSRGVAYFSFNTRYTSIDTTNPPLCERVLKEKFFDYSPFMKTQDFEAIIAFIKADKRFTQSKILLFGTSEGAIIAPLVAERQNVAVDALFLIGTPPENGYASALWQLNGGSSMVNFRAWFDTNGDRIVQKQEYSSGSEWLRKRLGNNTFEQFDFNHDSVITEEDFQVVLSPRRIALLDAIKRHDDEWIWKNYFHIGAQWFEAHRQLGSNTDRILRLTLPVYVFHGSNDANCPVESIVTLRALAEKGQRKNIHVSIFEGHDHSLNFFSWLKDGKPSPGWQSIVEHVLSLQ